MEWKACLMVKAHGECFKKEKGVGTPGASVHVLRGGGGCTLIRAAPSPSLIKVPLASCVFSVLHFKMPAGRFN